MMIYLGFNLNKADWCTKDYKNPAFKIRTSKSWKILENPRKSWKIHKILENPGKSWKIQENPGKF
jgi:hypothetical protein